MKCNHEFDDEVCYKCGEVRAKMVLCTNCGRKHEPSTNCSPAKFPMNTDNTISFDRVKLAKLKRYYNRALKYKRDQFTFEGSELLVAYAKYLIEYLEGRFNDKT